MWRLIIALTAPASPLSHADDFGGWTFSSPAGRCGPMRGAGEADPAQGEAFCQFVLSAVRAPTADDMASEWKELIDDNFNAPAPSQPVSQTSQRCMPMSMRYASVVDKGGMPISPCFTRCNPGARPAVCW